MTEPFRDISFIERDFIPTLEQISIYPTEKFSFISNSVNVDIPFSYYCGAYGKYYFNHLTKNKYRKKAMGWHALNISRGKIKRSFKHTTMMQEDWQDNGIWSY